MNTHGTERIFSCVFASACIGVHGFPAIHVARVKSQMSHVAQRRNFVGSKLRASTARWIAKHCSARSLSSTLLFSNDFQNQRQHHGKRNCSGNATDWNHNWCIKTCSRTESGRRTSWEETAHTSRGALRSFQAHPTCKVTTILRVREPFFGPLCVGVVPGEDLEEPLNFFAGKGFSFSLLLNWN